MIRSSSARPGFGKAGSGKAGSGKIPARRLLIGAAALLVPVLAGCEAGANAPTLEFHPAAAGAYADVNGITISNAFVLGAPSGSSVPAGSSAGMFVGLYNGGTSNDQLVSVSAPGTATSTAIKGGTIGLPGESAVNLTGPQPEIILRNLTRSLTGGQAVPVTLNFAHAGSVTLNVPVQPHSYYYSQYSQPPSPTPTPARPTPTAPATHRGAKTPTETPGASAKATPAGSPTPSPTA